MRLWVIKKRLSWHRNWDVIPLCAELILYLNSLAKRVSRGERPNPDEDGAAVLDGG